MTDQHFPANKIVVNYGPLVGPVFSSGDIHADELSFIEAVRLWRKIRRERRKGLALLILIGDVFGQTRLRHYQRRLLEKISALANHDGLTVVWIRGNHDRPFTDWIQQSFSDRIILCDEFLWTNANADQCFAVHGDEWDDHEHQLLGRPIQYWFYTQLYWFFRLRPFGCMFLCRILRRYKQWSPDWNRVCQMVRDGVVARAREMKANIVVFGHTHRRETHTLADGMTVINLGTAAEPNEAGWVRIDRNGSIESGCL